MPRKDESREQQLDKDLVERLIIKLDTTNDGITLLTLRSIDWILI